MCHLSSMGLFRRPQICHGQTVSSLSSFHQWAQVVSEPLDLDRYQGFLHRFCDVTGLFSMVLFFYFMLPTTFSNSSL